MWRWENERELREQWESLHMDVHVQEQLARDKAEAAVAARLDGMNELRTQINTERGSYATRDYVDAVNNSVDGRLKTLETGTSYRSGQLWVIGAIIVLINLGLYFLGKR